MFTKTAATCASWKMSHRLISHSSTLLCCPLTFIGTVHPVSQIQQGGVFQQSSNKLKKENEVFFFFSGCDWAHAEIRASNTGAVVLRIVVATAGFKEDFKI